MNQSGGTRFLAQLVGRLQREITRKLSAIGQAVSEALDTTLAKARQIWEQTAGRKTKGGRPKLYSWHAPEVQCINKGKSRQPYEFGAKVGIATTLKHNLIVGAKAFSGNPFDGHTLNRIRPANTPTQPVNELG